MPFMICCVYIGLSHCNEAGKKKNFVYFSEVSCAIKNKMTVTNWSNMKFSYGPDINTVLIGKKEVEHLVFCPFSEQKQIIMFELMCI